MVVLEQMKKKKLWKDENITNEWKIENLENNYN